MPDPNKAPEQDAVTDPVEEDPANDVVPPPEGDAGAETETDEPPVEGEESATPPEAPGSKPADSADEEPGLSELLEGLSPEAKQKVLDEHSRRMRRVRESEREAKEREQSARDLATRAIGAIPQSKAEVRAEEPDPDEVEADQVLSQRFPEPEDRKAVLAAMKALSRPNRALRDEVVRLKQAFGQTREETMIGRFEASLSTSPVKKAIWDKYKTQIIAEGRERCADLRDLYGRYLAEHFDEAEAILRETHRRKSTGPTQERAAAATPRGTSTVIPTKRSSDGNEKPFQFRDMLG